jgi:hypothetical protein
MNAKAYRILVAATVAGLALTVGGSAVAGGPIGSLPRGWSHAEINVTIKGQAHTLILDRGRVQSTSTSTLVLKERDGSVVTVPVSSTTKVRVNGQPGSLSDVQVGFLAVTVRVDGGAAKRVHAFDPARRAG